MPLPVVLTIVFGTPGAQAAPHIIAWVDTKANVILTAEEPRAVSVAAGRLLRHTYDEQVAFRAKDKTKAAVGKLSYEDEDTVKASIIPIFDELDKVSLLASLHQAKAGKDKTAYISPYQTLDEILQELRQRADHMAIVVDEFSSAMGMITMEDVLGIELPSKEFHTVGGLIMARLRYIPKEGETIIESGYRFAVEKATERSILSMCAERA